MPTKPIKIGIIGCGHIAQKHLESYEKIMQVEGDLFRITSVCDMVEESARAMAARIAAWQDVEPLVHTDVHKMVVHYELHGADICTPHYDHHVTGVQCLEAGTNVLIEKPFGLTSKASRLIVEAAREHKLITACAGNIRRQPAQRALHCDYAGYLVLSDGWGHDQALTDTGEAFTAEAPASGGTEEQA